MPETTDDLTLSEALEAAPEPERTLAKGLRGHDVARLQLELKRGGIDPGPIDGIFGDKTEAAVATFRQRHGIAEEGVGRETFAKVIEVAARDRHGDLKAAAEELEARAAELRERANGLEAEAGTRRDGGDREEAGGLMEEAGEAWIEGSSAWELAGELWIEAAHVIEPFVATGGDEGWKAYARWARATDAARLYAGRARTALGKAEEDLTASGSTEHVERIAAAKAEARARAAH